MIYLDAAATTPVRREVLKAMAPYLTTEFGNASSHHALGERAAHALADAHARVAAVLGCRANEVIFTSGGTEADNLALKGIALAATRGSHVVTSAIEHEAVLASCDFLRRVHGFEITILPVDRLGRIVAAELARALRPETTLCSIMLASNEVGTVQPIAELARMAHERGIPLHTDAVQAAGALDLDVVKLGVDAMSLSGHKIGAPKGVGVLFVRGRLPLEPVLHGGGQERGRRSGTENIAGIVGFAMALELAERERVATAARMTAMRNELIRGVLDKAPGAMLTGDPEQRLPNHASFCFPGTSGEAVLLQLEERGILCSSGSACAAGSDEPSHVLLAMGIAPEIAQTAVRFTLGQSVVAEDIPKVVEQVARAVEAVRGLAAHR